MSETGQRTLAAIVFTDAVEYSAKVGRDEDASVAAIRADLELMSRMTEKFDGRVLKSMGDGLMLIFTSAVNAVSCALEIQKTFQERAKENPESTPFLHRIGVHLGDVLLVDNDAHGDGVNVASRLQERAEPGGICLSQTVYDVVKGRLFLQAIPLGELSLKHVAEPVNAYRVAGVAAARKEVRKLPAWAAIAAGVVLLVGASATTAFFVSNRPQAQPMYVKADTTELDKKIAELSRIAAEIDRKNSEPRATPPEAVVTSAPLNIPVRKQESPKATARVTEKAKPITKVPSPAVPAPRQDVPTPPKVITMNHPGSGLVADFDPQEFEDLKNFRFQKYDFGPLVKDLSNLPKESDFAEVKVRFQKLDGLMDWIREETAKATDAQPIQFRALGNDAVIVGGDEEGIKVKVGNQTMDRKFEDLSPGQMILLMQCLALKEASAADKQKALESIRVFADEYGSRAGTHIRKPKGKGNDQP